MAATSRRHTQAEIIQTLKQTKGLVTLAAARLGISPQAIYKRAKKSPAIQEAIDASRDELIDQAELGLRNAVAQQQPWAIALVLNTIGKNRGYVKREEITGANGQPLETVRIYVPDNHRNEPSSEG